MKAKLYIPTVSCRSWWFFVWHLEEPEGSTPIESCKHIATWRALAVAAQAQRRRLAYCPLKIYQEIAYMKNFSFPCAQLRNAEIRQMNPLFQLDWKM
jgi:hypothetical protein